MQPEYLEPYSQGKPQRELVSGHLEAGREKAKGPTVPQQQSDTAFHCALEVSSSGAAATAKGLCEALAHVAGPNAKTHSEPRSTLASQGSFSWNDQLHSSPTKKTNDRVLRDRHLQCTRPHPQKCLELVKPVRTVRNPSAGPTHARLLYSVNEPTPSYSLTCEEIPDT